MNPTPLKKRPDSLEEQKVVRQRLLTEDEIVRALAFKPNEDDVIISPWAKSGTTWTQQMVHCLRTRGDMDFEDISSAIPWIETSEALGIDLSAPQRGRPRAFKSHLPWHTVPKGARYIVSLRDPRDQVVSLYRFFEGWFFEPGSVDINEFVEDLVTTRTPENNYWVHLVSWWEQKDNPRVLLHCYEYMLANPRKTIERVAAFIGVQLDEALRDMTLEYTSMEFMLKHKHQFSDAPMRRLSEARCDLPADSDSAKVRQGQSGTHRQELSEETIRLLDETWQTEVAPKTGHRNYETLAAQLAETG
ncbi:MAG: sulfotransferase domain-containing protein [Gammaproteobacteria bacterium]|nr:sulfotransferase domain-containing protein [Gammaproteobacteria bacterium]